ncbi:hypothetical protein CRH15_19400 [Lelliottia amnigena]|nr:hypothetical protein CO697_18250 [Lelliottia amnigena]PEG63225.1 hypothetical protein CRH15_19400 [Lelliottia amnigena]
MPVFTQTYPQCCENLKNHERCANVFVKMHALNKDAPLGVLDEFFAKNSSNTLCHREIQGIYHATTSSSPPRSAQCF